MIMIMIMVMVMVMIMIMIISLLSIAMPCFGKVVLFAIYLFILHVGCKGYVLTDQSVNPGLVIYSCVHFCPPYV